MARVELPASRLKARKRKRRLRVFAFIAGGCALLLGAAVALSHAPFLLVREVSLSGMETIASSTLRGKALQHLSGSYAFVFPKRNIFLYPKEAIREDLLRLYPALASVDVHAVDFQTIAVNVVERHPRALWCEGTRCYLMDENGTVYGDAPTFSEPIYISYSGAASGEGLPKQYLTPSEFQALSALVDAVASHLPEERVQGVSVDGARDVYARFASGFSIYFPLDDQGGDVFERFTLALKSEPLLGRPLSDFLYLDLRFGDKLYYKLKEKSSEGSEL